MPERKKITNERAVGIAGAKERRERNEETRIEAQRDESRKERARYLRTRDHEYRVAVGSLSGALLLGVESGSRPPTLDFERYPFSFYYLPSLHPRVDVPHRARSLSLETHLVRETFVPSIFHAERNATPRFNYIRRPVRSTMHPFSEFSPVLYAFLRVAEKRGKLRDPGGGGTEGIAGTEARNGGRS